MQVERYWEDTFASRITLVSDQCEVGYCIVTLLYCHTFSGKRLHKTRKMCNFPFLPDFVHEMPEPSKNVIVNTIVRLLSRALSFF